MAQKKFKPKSGNPAKAAEELRAFKDRVAREEQERAKARQERKDALSMGEQVETNGMFKSAPREKPPAPYTFNMKSDGSSAGVTYTPRTTLTPAHQIQSNFVPRENLDDVIDPASVVTTTKKGKVKPVMPKAGMTKRKAGNIFLATLGISTMVAVGIIVPSLSGAMSIPSQPVEAEEGSDVLVDRNGVPLDGSAEDVDFATGDNQGGFAAEDVEVEVSTDGSASTDPSAIPSAEADTPEEK